MFGSRMFEFTGCEVKVKQNCFTIMHNTGIKENGLRRDVITECSSVLKFNV